MFRSRRSSKFVSRSWLPLFQLPLALFILSMLARCCRQHAGTHPGHTMWKTNFAHVEISALVPSSGHRAYMTPSMHRHSHSKPHHVSPSQRERAMLRPAETFNAPTGVSRGKHQKHATYFLASPTIRNKSTSSQRNPRLSGRRASVKECKKPQQLLAYLSDAIAAEEADASVVAAAMQTCGHNYWWETLMQVHDMAVDNGIEFDSIQFRIFMNAMAACLRGSQCDSLELSTRKDRALSLSKQTWNCMPAQSSEQGFRRSVTVAWRVCAEIGAVALPWAEELISFCKTQKFSLDIMAYAPLLCLLEQCGYQDRVDHLVDEIVQRRGLDLNEVVLGGLINAACTDWKRVEKIWDLLVNKYHVQPNTLCFTARSKAHFLARRPRAAAKILQGSQLDTSRAVAMHLQSQLIVCHAELSKASKQKLRKCLARAQTADTSKDGRQLISELEQLIELSRQLLREPSSVRLPALVVMRFARRMRDWPHHEAGSKYLPTDDF